MNTRNVIWISGLILSSIMAFFWFISFRTCNENIGCLLYLALPLFPGIILNLEGITSIVVSLFFWFLLGALIGFLISKIKNRN